MKAVKKLIKCKQDKIIYRSKRDIKKMIEIRKYKPADVAPFYEAVIESIEEVSIWLPWCHNNYNKEETENWVNKIVPQLWKSNKGFEFIIEHGISKKILGGCCLEQVDLINKTAGIGYWVRNSETKNGIATQACRHLFEFGFNQLKLEEINIIPSVKNLGSIKVAEKLPFNKKTLVKNGFQIRDEISDAMIYSFTKKTFERNN